MFPLLVLASTGSALAHSGGQTARSIVGCSCHGAAADPTTTVTFGPAPAVVLPGEVVPLTFTVSSTSVSRVAGGLDVSATAGTLVPGAGGAVKLSNSEITHTGPGAFTAGAITFAFDWTAPAADGFYTLHGAGNAVNLNGGSSGDGWSLATDLVIEVDNACDDLDGDGFDTCEGDCDDTDATVSPQGIEVCDGRDNDCSGTADDDASDAGLFYPDADLDGFGDDTSSVRACTAPFNHLGTRGDCDDGNAAVNPNAVEICDAGDIDQDCDGVADDPSASGTTPWFVDGDGDGFGAGAPIVACDAPPGTIAVGGDCDDADAGFNPGVIEDCSEAIDRNCDGATGAGDNDNDGYAACVECNDADSAVFPGAFERCNGEDDDCDGAVDEDDALDALTWYRDRDGDGHGDPSLSSEACAAPPGFVASPADCDDGNAEVGPDAAEIWYDGIDQTCDGNDDDQDGDGVPVSTDCLDTDPDAYPGAADLPYDGVDADCLGNDDFDADADGHPAAPPEGTGDDCDDTDPDVHPGLADPPCDGVDQDCTPAPDTDPACAPETADTGGPPGDEPAPPTTEDPPKTGCGCASTGAAAWLGLLPVLLAARRRTPGARRRTPGART